MSISTVLGVVTPRISNLKGFSRFSALSLKRFYTHIAVLLYKPKAVNFCAYVASSSSLRC